jgi:hypothetical protein
LISASSRHFLRVFVEEDRSYCLYMHFAIMPCLEASSAVINCSRRPEKVGDVIQHGYMAVCIPESVLSLLAGPKNRPASSVKSAAAAEEAHRLHGALKTYKHKQQGVHTRLQAPDNLAVVVPLHIHYSAAAAAAADDDDDSRACTCG